MVSISSDITETKHTERALRELRRTQESLKIFRDLMDRSTDAIEVIDPITLRFLDCNVTAHQRLGYSREEFLALSVFNIDPTLDALPISRRGAERPPGGGDGKVRLCDLRERAPAERRVNVPGRNQCKNYSFGQEL